MGRKPESNEDYPRRYDATYDCPHYWIVYTKGSRPWRIVPHSDPAKIRIGLSIFSTEEKLIALKTGHIYRNHKEPIPPYEEFIMGRLTRGA